jgi:hypothetical protein
MMYLNITTFRQFIGFGFSIIFFLFSLSLAGLTLQEIWHGLSGSENLIGAFVKAINIAVIALAIFELGLVVNKEYGETEDDHILIVLRRTVPRFVSIVCIALVLEGLLLVIKYSQLELAGNLYYPVAIIIAASMLLMSLGVFLRFSNHSEQEAHEHAWHNVPAQATHGPLQSSTGKTLQEI